jgi:DNA segregation ATPase FtsK/SpoIIIE-like protein
VPSLAVDASRTLPNVIAVRANLGTRASLRVPLKEKEMPEDVEELTPEELQLPNEIQAQLRIGRKAAKESEALQAQIKSMEKQSAIERAGVPDHPAREVVFKDYDGPLDGDSIREHAAKMGIAAVQESATQVTPQEQNSMRQVLNAGGGTPPQSGDIDAAIAMRNAKSQKEVLEIVAQIAGTPGFRSRDGLIGELPQPI